MNTKKYTLAEIADFLSAELHGDEDCIVDSIAPLDKATNHQISFLEKARFRPYLETTEAAAVILSQIDFSRFKGNKLIVANPYANYAKLTKLFCPDLKASSGISERAVVGENTTISPTAVIAPNCVIGNNVVIGDSTVIQAGTVIGDNVTIGDNCHVYPNVTIYYDVKIGSNVILHSGVVLGADGFGMANENGRWVKIHQLGDVIIGNDVEIGANTCVDRAALESTIIEDGVKLDNLIQIGHNVIIGAHTIMAGCSVVAGSTKIGRYCMIGGATTFNGHIEIPDQTIITGGSTVGFTLDEPGVYSSGLTVQPHRKWMRIVSKLIDSDKSRKNTEEVEND